MYLAGKMPMTHCNIYLIYLPHSFIDRNPLKFLVTLMPLPHNLLILLLFLNVITLQLIINIHVHVVLLHSCEFLLDTAANVVFTLLDGLHLDEDVVKLTGMLRVYVYVQDLQVLLD